MKNYGDNVFNMRNLPGGTFAQSVIDSAIGTAGSLADFAGFVPKLSGIKQRMMLAADFYGTGSSLNVTRLELGTDNGDLHLLVDGGIKNYPADAAWYANVNQFSANHAAIASFVSTATGKEVPAILTRTGDVSMTGYVGGGSNKIGRAHV